MPKKRDEHKTSTTENFLKEISKKRERQEQATKAKENYQSYVNYTTRVRNFGNMIINSLNSFFDRTLSSLNSVRVLSFIFAAMLVFYVNGGDFSSILRTPTSGEFLNSVPLEIEGLSNDLVCLGAPDTVTIGLIGPSLDIYSTKLSKDYSAYIDLTNATVGESTMELKASGFPSDLQVLIVPQTVKVTIAQKVTKTYNLGYEFINRNNINADLSVAVESMEHDQVEVSGAQSQLDLINSVKVQVDVANQTENFTQNGKVVAYDRSGNPLDVTITPNTVNVSCSVSDYSKEVKVVPTYSGQLASGYAISEANFSDTVVKLYGKEEDLASIESVSVTLDISDLSQSKSFEDAKLNIPNVVYKTSITTVDVDLIIEENSSTKIISDIPIVVANNTKSYNVAFNSNQDVASIKVTGPASKVAALTGGDIKASIDMTNVSIGTTVVPVKIELDDTYTYEFVSLSEVEIAVSQ
ncbi:MAG: CdaR family protein [Erysipelotrichaceae bacterium]|nr:CdaR family protein [Erysipelotrichaceae bacterium]MDD3809918.1 CdaR family protein [Erysipelotrichaceae bacterium]